MNSGDYLIPKDIYDELFGDYIELVLKEEQLEQELEKLKKPINYYQYASKNLKDKNEQLQQENAQLKNKLKDIEKILDADYCVENVYQAICQYLNIHDFELDLEDYLKEN